MADIVIREVVPGVVTFSKPFKRMSTLPIGGRTTACALSDGSVWVLASTPLSPATKAKLDSMGQVKHIACVDSEHTLFIKEYVQAYPDARLVGPEGTSAAIGIECNEFTGDAAKDAGVMGTGKILEEIKAEYFGGFVNKDIAFLHVPSKSLIQGDLLFNLPAKEQYSQTTESNTSFFSRFVDLRPQSTFHKRFVYTFGAKDRASMARSTNVVDAWDFTRIIPCHGDVIENDGKAAWRSVYEWYFNDIKAGKFPGLTPNTTS